MLTRAKLVLCLLLAPALAPRPLRAQERRNDAHPGGRVALCAKPFVWTVEECREFLGERTGERVVLTVDAAAAPDPLAPVADSLTLGGLVPRRFVLDPAVKWPSDAPELAAAVEQAQAIELHGGTWLDWWKVLLPNGKASRLALAIHAAHRRGVPALGTGAGAGFLASYSLVERATLGREERNFHRPDTASSYGGLGLALLVFDGDGLPGATLERDLRLLLRNPFDACVHLAGESAWIVDERAGEARVLGRNGGAALVVDLKDARRMRESLREGRITRLDPGDRWDLARRRPRPEAREHLGDPGDPGDPGDIGRARSQGGAPRTLAVDDPLAAASILAALAGHTELRKCTWVAPRVELRLVADQDTLGGGGRAIARARFDVLWEYPEPVR